MIPISSTILFVFQSEKKPHNQIASSLNKTKMLLLDSLYINNSGGKILLEYLVEQLEKHKVPVFYLFDDRCKDDFKNVPKRRKVYLKANLLNRHQFYRRKGKKFSHVLCFGNLAPTIALKVPVYTYFHQTLFLELPDTLSFINKIKFKIKTKILDTIKSNTSIWLVQSLNIKKGLMSQFELKKSQVRILPFYPPLKKNKKVFNRRKDGFVYISNGGAHKNHNNLIEAFCKFFDKYNKGILHLTINEEFPELLNLINEKTAAGYPILNHGFINREELVEIYKSNHYLIFPSLTESFGLGLVEAIENGCKVMGADLPYTYAVCKPSIIFNPLKVKDIKRAFVESQAEHVKDTEQLVFNEIDELIELLTKSENR